ncbi:Hsp20/alpha crystallin family protein [Luteimonas abyssi]|uniref:Hsp20/alpha crystallin family protein n=1 Tax=Luteimonas abyssi TaxID=1247514 RepID=UPI000737C850|nr:Hsp20/alpha crystallin family protein [Luteimonas abyssi]
MRQAIRFSRFPVRGLALQHPLYQGIGPIFRAREAQAGDRDAAVASWMPHVDVREEEGRFVILADLPGVDPQSVEVLMDNGMLSLRGEREAPALEDGVRVSRTERRHGAFQRRFALPDSADPAGVTASGRHGVLEISIPKRAERAPRRIQVETGLPVTPAAGQA